DVARLALTDVLDGDFGGGLLALFAARDGGVVLGGDRGEAARDRDRFDDAHRGRVRVRAGLRDLPEDVDLLRGLLLDEDGDLRVAYEVLGEALGDQLGDLLRLEADDLDVAGEREADGALGADAIGARELALAEDVHLERVTDAKRGVR